MLVTRTVDRIAAPTAAERDAVLAAPVRADSFEAAFAASRCLHAIEVARTTGDRSSPCASARVVFWNAERLKYLGAVGGAARSAPMPMSCSSARSMWGWPAPATATRWPISPRSWRTGYVFGIEFVELGLGDARERAWHAGQSNRGRPAWRRHPVAAQLCSGPPWSGSRPRVVGSMARFGERRVGGRIALLAEIPIAGTPVLFVAAHYESHSDPADRLEQTRTLLDAVDARSPGSPS